MQNKRMSIRISTDGFSFYALKGWRHYPVGEDEILCVRLDEELARLQQLKANYEEVSLLADYPSTRVPLDEFRSEHEQSVYRLTLGEDSLQGLSIRHEVIAALDVVELFPVNTEALDVVRKYFPQVTVRGFYAWTVEECHADYKKHGGEETKRLYASIEGEELFLCVFSDNGLAFANSYADGQLNNRLYFTLQVWKLMGMDQEKDILVLRGEDSDLAALLRKYIRNVECE